MAELLIVYHSRTGGSRQMAEAADVAEGTLFRAFGDKESILRAAIERFASAPAAYAAVMLDVTMPGLGGVEATTAIHSLRPGMPVVLMSGFTTDVVPADLAHVTFLSKPFRVEALVDALEQALG